MSEAQNAAVAGRQVYPSASRSNDAMLARVVYRSQAVGPLTPADLHQLTAASQSRNSREGLSGLMLYDNDHFFQWLEGPGDGVERVMGSIRNDRRHTSIEILSQDSAPARVFGDWSMKLATRVPASVSWRREIIEPPPEIVQDLRLRPSAAPALLVKLVPVAGPSVASGNSAADSLARVPLHAKTASILRSVMLSTVIPRLALERGVGAGPAVNKRAAELADLLVDSDQAAAIELIEELHASEHEFARLYATLFEPAARRLGDLWSDDTCSEFDVTLGLIRLQSAMRLLSADAVRKMPRGLSQPVVLIAPEPGELHRLGAALDSDVLWHAGWTPQCEYPVDDKSLQDLVSTSWFDVLDLSLSTAFRRDHWLPRITTTIAQARLASRNPALMVVVGGRVFAEQGDAGSEVGADLAMTTALHVDRSILASLDTVPKPR